MNFFCRDEKTSHFRCPSECKGFTGSAVGKTSSANVGDARDRFDPWVGKIPWRRKWQLAPIFLLGKLYRERSLVGYGLWSCKE